MANSPIDSSAQPSPQQGEIVLVIEEVLPWENITQTNRRVIQYLKAGVPLIWLINYHERLVTIFPRGKGMEVAEEKRRINGLCVLRFSV